MTAMTAPLPVCLLPYVNKENEKLLRTALYYADGWQCRWHWVESKAEIDLRIWNRSDNKMDFFLCNVSRSAAEFIASKITYFAKTEDGYHISDSFDEQERRVKKLLKKNKGKRANSASKIDAAPAIPQAAPGAQTCPTKPHALESHGKEQSAVMSETVVKLANNVAKMSQPLTSITQAVDESKISSKSQSPSVPAVSVDGSSSQSDSGSSESTDSSPNRKRKRGTVNHTKWCGECTKCKADGKPFHMSNRGQPSVDHISCLPSGKKRHAICSERKKERQEAKKKRKTSSPSPVKDASTEETLMAKKGKYEQLKMECQKRLAELDKELAFIDDCLSLRKG